jgi:proteic killer suppression protein
VDILFGSDKLRELLNSERLLKRKHGAANMKIVAQRMSDLRAAPRLKDMEGLPGRCEELKGDRRWQLSLRLQGAKRLIFEPAHNPVPRKSDGGLDWAQVSRIRILEIIDYHG